VSKKTTISQHYREWARCIYKKPENLLQTIGITPGADQACVRVTGSAKPSKGFKIGRVELIQNIQSFLAKMERLFQ